jgi:hypothetical protein
MAKKPLCERLKTGELYFVFTGIDFKTGDFWMLCFGDGSPRIYKKGSLDPRVGDIPICGDLKNAQQKLKKGAMGVLLPLSELLEVFGARSVGRWASNNPDELAAEMRAYIKKWKQMVNPLRLTA